MKSVVLAITGLLILGSVSSNVLRGNSGEVQFIDESSLTNSYPDLPTAGNITVTKVMGHWFSFASLPNAIETFCHCTQTVYTLQDDNTISFDESCRFFGPWGPSIHSQSKGYVNPKLGDTSKWINEVDKGPLHVKADYWILRIDEDYKWMLVGQPSRKNLWVLSRVKEMDGNVYLDLLDWAKSYGFDTDKVEINDQTCENPNKALDYLMDRTVVPVLTHIRNQ
eukprot:TRINITY_DN778_c0_g1_i1.p1 TRINITY_DN778_c0_g1~~TRINITY_DN778_c0_g1_i1.p1  ORF type:complete len:223 (-),score=48.01 TRINITY_DN778_c0_g1_i1:187-855(-)